MTQRSKVYAKLLLASIPRILSSLDRDPYSSTYGSFDREYWAWATKDFSNIDLQRAVYPLSIIYINNFEGNYLYKDKKLLEWISAGINFWMNSQYKNGSHDHHYPFEHSFVGAAFTLYELTEAINILGDDLSDQFKSDLTKCFSLAGDFLCENNETHGFISNHRIGAACGLENLYKITQLDKYKVRSKELIKSVYSKRSIKEGWLFEYSGADPGYQTLAIYYMANYYRITNDEEFLNNLIKPSLEFIQYFIHPDGSIGGEYGSRNCSLYFPAGFEILSKFSQVAELIANSGISAISNDATPSLSSMDIRNFVPMLSNYAQATLENKKSMIHFTVDLDLVLPFSRNFEKYWDHAGIYIRSTKLVYIILGLSKGGVLKVFSKKSKKLIFSSSGYQIKLNNNKSISNQFMDEVKNNPQIKITDPLKIENRIIHFNSNCYEVITNRTQTKLNFILFRVFTFTLGRNIFIANLFKRIVITKFFIHRKCQVDLTIQRSFNFSENLILIQDQFVGNLLPRVKEIVSSEIFTTIYMASSKYYRLQELVINKSKLDNINGDTTLFQTTINIPADE